MEHQSVVFTHTGNAQYKVAGGVMKKPHSFCVCQGGDQWSPWEVKMRDGDKQIEISVVETIRDPVNVKWNHDEGREFLNK